MKIAILKERHPGETRVAASPDMVKKLAGMGVDVTVEAGAGNASGILDAAFADAGATIAADPVQTLTGAEAVFKVRRPVVEGEGDIDELALIPDGALLIGLINPLADRGQFRAYAAKRLTVLAMELVPRISRAQSMDALSSQANLAGYKSVLDACIYYKRAMPLMMTAAGTLAPAKVLILGAGVAGLQAIATARRLGAVVSAFDVRPAVKGQVESLGASFVEVEGAQDAETSGGYAREMGEDYKRRQAEAIHNALKKSDICITTAQIPGRPSPRLITAGMVRDMKPGSVIVDLAAEGGGNCELTQYDQVVQTEGVAIVGFANVAARMGTDASALYARNLLNLVQPFVDKESGALVLDFEDEVIAGACAMKAGELVHPTLIENQEG
ncbi:MAG: Re/Si-specific NAD(P)(+) transhydrogenase subunit alpha [Alphaproteobacteria bacterium]|nr:Re/Si-specific NAD(P)(+) transhydrogenase subunit alpha [Alphaproteobacteria bacterium]